jgi:hypothetical protein
MNVLKPDFTRLAIILIATATTLPADIIPLTFPSTVWGQGGVNILLNVNAPASGTAICTSGFGSPLTGNTCNAAITSNIGVVNGGSSSATATAYVDANGLHSYATVSSTGDEESTAEAMSAVSDTITNNSGIDATFQIGFNVDAQLSDNGGAYSYLYIETWHGYAYSPVQDGAAGALQFYALGGGGANPTLNQTINQNYLTTAVLLAPGASYTWTISMDAYAVTDQFGTSPDAPDAITNALNTLALTSFTAVSDTGVAISPLDFGSADGIQYSSIDPPQTSATPEPSTFTLTTLFLLCSAGWYQARRLAIRLQIGATSAQAESDRPCA